MPVNTTSQSASTETARAAGPGPAAGPAVKMEGGGGAAAVSSAAGGSSRSSGSNPSGALWKNESEETVKTRKNALRVIVTKFRNFWPTEDDTKLTSRATLLEKGVFDVTLSKQDYIQKLQRDLNVLSQKKESEKKHARQLIQTSGDAYAMQSGKDQNPAQYSADAKAKFLQRLHSMERKHQQMLMLLKQPDDRPAVKGTETQIKQIVMTFRQLSQQKETGPFDLESLNKIDEQLEKYRLTMSRARAVPNRDGVEKQNDRTMQVGTRMLDKLRRLNKDRPFVVTELAWSMEEDLPDLGPPPELLCLGPSKREAPAVYAQELKPKIRRLAEPPPGVHPDGHAAPVLHRVCPYRSPGGDCVPCVRESFMEAPCHPPSFRNKGFLDADNPNDTGEQPEQLGVADTQVAMPLSVEAAFEQLKFAAITFQHPHFEAPELVVESGLYGTGVSSDACFVLRAKEESWGWDGELVLHSITVKILRDAFPEDALPWDCRVVCLRRLPVEVHQTPDANLDSDALSRAVAKGHSLSPADWLVELLWGAASHVRALHTVWEELRALQAAFPDMMLISLQQPKDGSPGVGLHVRCSIGGQDNLGCALELAVPVKYPKAQPTVILSRASTGVASGRVFETKFRKLLDGAPSPHSVSQLVTFFLDVCGQALEDTFHPYP